MRCGKRWNITLVHRVAAPEEHRIRHFRAIEMRARAAGDPCANRCLISRRCHSHPRNRRIGLRRGLHSSRGPDNVQAAWRNQVCPWRQLISPTKICLCKSKLSVRRYEQRSWGARKHPHRPTSPLPWREESRQHVSQCNMGGAASQLHKRSERNYAHWPGNYRTQTVRVSQRGGWFVPWPGHSTVNVASELQPYRTLRTGIAVLA